MALWRREGRLSFFPLLLLLLLLLFIPLPRSGNASISTFSLPGEIIVFLILFLFQRATRFGTKEIILALFALLRGRREKRKKEKI